MFLKITFISLLIFPIKSTATGTEGFLQRIKRDDHKTKIVEQKTNPRDQLSKVLKSVTKDTIDFEDIEKQTSIDSLENTLRSLSRSIKSSISISPESKKETPPIMISGFGDILRKDKTFAIGQAEIALETNIAQVVFVTAMAYGDEIFGLGTFEISLPILGRGNNHFRTAQHIVTAKLSVGQSDIPFGLDYQIYSSIARKLITTPLVVERTHNSWNDIGIRGYLETVYFKMDLFSSNGFSYTKTNFQKNTITLQPKVALGGRLGFIPLSGIELGGSVASVWDENNCLGMVLLGVDTQFQYKRLTAKGEYIWHQISCLPSDKVSNKGFYTQAFLTFDPVFFITRYDHFIEDNSTNESRLSTGIGYVIVEGCEFRVEHQFRLDQVSDISFIQMVVGF